MRMEALLSPWRQPKGRVRSSYVAKPDRTVYTCTYRYVRKPELHCTHWSIQVSDESDRLAGGMSHPGFSRSECQNRRNVLIPVVLCCLQVAVPLSKYSCNKA